MNREWRDLYEELWGISWLFFVSLRGAKPRSNLKTDRERRQRSLSLSQISFSWRDCFPFASLRVAMTHGESIFEVKVFYQRSFTLAKPPRWISPRFQKLVWWGQWPRFLGDHLLIAADNCTFTLLGTQNFTSTTLTAISFTQLICHFSPPPALLWGCLISPQLHGQIHLNCPYNLHPQFKSSLSPSFPLQDHQLFKADF